MNIFLDGIIFSLQSHGGITVYFRELVKYINSCNIKASLMLSEPSKQNLLDLTGGVSTIGQDARLFERFRPCLMPFKSDVFHSSYYRLPERMYTPSVVTVHDFTYERFRKGPAAWLHSIQKNTAIRRAQAIICISESTRDDLLEFVGVRENQSIHIIHNGVGELFKPVSVSPSKQPFILFVGDRVGYKNFFLAVSALEYLSGVELFCVGGGALAFNELKNFSPAIQARVRHLGYVADEELNRLYNQAVCLIYPSKYEGFGIPVVEAMKAGCPVICVNCKAVLEVGGEALEVIEDENPRDIAEGVRRLFALAYRQKKIESGLKRAKNYSWTKCHEKTINLYRSLI